MKFLHYFFIFIFCSISAQKKYYLLLGNRKFSSEKYNYFKDSISTHGKLSERIKLTFKKNDSIFVLPDLRLDSENISESFFDELNYNKKNFKEKINFRNLNIVKENKNIDPSKPYFISCWFTHCPPCIGEIPDLNKLKEKYYDQFNFIAITFDNLDEVNKILIKYPFNFIQFTNQKKLLDKMEIIAYPTNFILDKEGNFVDYIYPSNPVSIKYTTQKIEKFLRN